MKSKALLTSSNSFLSIGAWSVYALNAKELYQTRAGYANVDHISKDRTYAYALFHLLFWGLVGYIVNDIYNKRTSLGIGQPIQLAGHLNVEIKKGIAGRGDADSANFPQQSMVHHPDSKKPSNALIAVPVHLPRKTTSKFFKNTDQSLMNDLNYPEKYRAHYGKKEDVLWRKKSHREKNKTYTDTFRGIGFFGAANMKDKNGKKRLKTSIQNLNKEFEKLHTHNEKALLCKQILYFTDGVHFTSIPEKPNSNHTSAIGTLKAIEPKQKPILLGRNLCYWEGKKAWFCGFPDEKDLVSLMPTLSFSKYYPGKVYSIEECLGVTLDLTKSKSPFLRNLIGPALECRYARHLFGTLGYQIMCGLKENPAFDKMTRYQLQYTQEDHVNCYRITIATQKDLIYHAIKAYEIWGKPLHENARAFKNTLVDITLSTLQTFYTQSHFKLSEERWRRLKREVPQIPLPTYERIYRAELPCTSIEDLWHQPYNTKNNGTFRYPNAYYKESRRKGDPVWGMMEPL